MLNKFEAYFAKQLDINVETLKESERNQFLKNLMQLVREVYPIRNIVTISLKSAGKCLERAVDLIAHTDEKVSK